MNALFGGFKGRYPQKFLDELAKTLGIKWTKVEFKAVPKEKVEVKPLGPPSGVLYYVDMKYGDTKIEKKEDDRE